MTVCYKKGKEQGLWYEIKCQEDLIKSPTISDRERAFAKMLLKNYKRLSESDYNRKSAKLPAQNLVA